MLLLLQLRCWYDAPVLMFYMAPDTLSHVEDLVMTLLSTIVYTSTSYSVYFYYIYLYNMCVLKLLPGTTVHAVPAVLYKSQTGTQKHHYKLYYS